MIHRTRPAHGPRLSFFAMLVALMLLATAVVNPQRAVADDDNLVEDAMYQALQEAMTNEAEKLHEELDGICETIAEYKDIEGDVREYESDAIKARDDLNDILEHIGNRYIASGKNKEIARQFLLYVAPAIAHLQRSDEWIRQVQQLFDVAEEAFDQAEEEKDDIMEKAKKAFSEDVLDDDELSATAQALNTLRTKTRLAISPLRGTIAMWREHASKASGWGTPGKMIAAADEKCGKVMLDQFNELCDEHPDILEWEDNGPGKTLEQLVKDSGNQFKVSLYKLRNEMRKYSFTEKLKEQQNAVKSIVAQYVALVTEEVKGDDPDDFIRAHDRYKQWFDTTDDRIDALLQSRLEWLAEANAAVTKQFSEALENTNDDRDKATVTKLQAEWEKDQALFHRGLQQQENELRTEHDWGVWKKGEAWEEKLDGEKGWAQALNMKANYCQDMAARIKKYDSLWNAAMDEFANVGGLAFAAGKIFGGDFGVVAQAIGMMTVIPKMRREMNAFCDFVELSGKAAEDGFAITYTKAPDAEKVLDALENGVRYANGDLMRAWERSARAIYNTSKRLGDAAVDLGLAGEERRNKAAAIKALNELFDGATDGPFDELDSWDFRDMDDAQSRTTAADWARVWTEELEPHENKVETELAKLPAEAREPLQDLIENLHQGIEDACKEMDERWDNFVEDVEEELED